VATRTGLYGWAGGCFTSKRQPSSADRAQVIVRVVQQQTGTGTRLFPLRRSDVRSLQGRLTVALAKQLGARTVVCNSRIVRGEAVRKPHRVVRTGQTIGGRMCRGVTPGRAGGRRRPTRGSGARMTTVAAVGGTGHTAPPTTTPSPPQSPRRRDGWVTRHRDSQGQIKRSWHGRPAQAVVVSGDGRQ